MKRSELKRGDKPLRANPDKTREWQNRSRKKIKPRSDKREEEAPARRALVDRVLRATPNCAAQIPTICTMQTSEVNELVRRSQWAAGYLVESNTEALCHNCHAFITAHPGIDGWAVRHGHQIEGSVHDLGGETYDSAYAKALMIRLRYQGCSADCDVDHRSGHG